MELKMPKNRTGAIFPARKAGQKVIKLCQEQANKKSPFQRTLRVKYNAPGQHKPYQPQNLPAQPPQSRTPVDMWIKGVCFRSTGTIKHMGYVNGDEWRTKRSFTSQCEQKHLMKMYNGITTYLGPGYHTKYAEQLWLKDQRYIEILDDDINAQERA